MQKPIFTVAQISTNIIIQGHQYSIINNSVFDPLRLMEWYCEERKTKVEDEISKRRNEFQEQAAQVFFNRCLQANTMETYPRCLGQLSVVYYLFRALFTLFFGEAHGDFLYEIKHLLLFSILNFCLLTFFQKML